MYKANLIGFGLAVGSSAFIGSSFIIKKKGLQRAGAAGSRAGSGGYGYLLEPLWWIGMITMVIGEFANFVAYMYAPAVLVTPLGALSIIVSAVLAHFLLKEKLRKLGILGCMLCVVGSTVIVLHAPGEHSISSVEEIWELAVQPAFLMYMASIAAVVLVLVLYCEPRYGQTNIMEVNCEKMMIMDPSLSHYILISSSVEKASWIVELCNIWGLSLEKVMSIKAIGIAIKLTLEGYNQVAHFKSWITRHFLKYHGSSMQMVRYGNRKTTMNCVPNMWQLYNQIILSEGQSLDRELELVVFVKFADSVQSRLFYSFCLFFFLFP
ncbi:hypothetical protein STAS_06732 [Striga asiatica]|uniref:Probable magnesium transporter n=1 Tax=Striga asiatica TaxID=4170 RepID=A0A5A7PET5_STRAF|nr:hypothetical protein STAS_06732 [Striga asiatica]